MRTTTRSVAADAAGAARTVRRVCVVAAVLLLGPAVLPATASTPDGTSSQVSGRGHGTRPQPVDLGVAGATDVIAISDSGVVIGTLTQDQARNRAFRWRDGVVEVMPGLARSMPVAVNDAGQVVVNGRYGDEPIRPYLWQPDGTVVDILGPGGEGIAGGLNVHGAVALSVHLRGDVDENYAAVWQDGALTALTTPGLGYAIVSSPPAINDRGEVAGTVTIGSTPTAWAWRHGVLELLDAPEGAASGAVGINQRGQVLVGGASPGPAVWERDGRLRTSDVEIATMAFDDRGLVAGYVAPLPAQRPLPAVTDLRRVTLLPTLGGPYGEVHGTSGRGVHVGWTATTAEPGVHPAAWVRGRVVALGERLDGLGTAAEGWAEDVNVHGQAVGFLHWSPGGDGYVSRAVLWELVPRR